MSMRAGSLLLLLALTLILSSSTLAGYALPDSYTERSGNLCEARHRFLYNYKFTYVDALQVGESTTLKITFTISGTEVTENPYTVTVKILSDGFGVSATALDLSDTNTGTITITPQSTDATLTVVTTLTLDGDYNRHRGYEATYTDTFELNGFKITTIPMDGGDTANSTDTSDTNSTNTTGVTDQTNSTDTETQAGGGAETDYPVEVVTESLIPWYIVRATGLLAFVTLSLSTTVAALRKINPSVYAPLFRHHHDISLIATVFMVAHVVNNLLDAAVWRLTLIDVLWFNPATLVGVMMSLGVAAFYTILIVTSTSFKPAIQRLKRGKWLNLHLASYAAYVFVVLHSLYLGTDTIWSDSPLSQLYFIVFWVTTILNAALVIHAFTRLGRTQP